MKDYTQADMLREIQKLMKELFEIDPATVQMDTRLVEDLDLDSIDAVDMIVHLQNMVGSRIKPDDFKAVRTVGDVVDVLMALVEKENA